MNNYWNHKLSLWLHDPVDKALSIPGHEKRAAKIAEAIGRSVAEKTSYQAADIIAAGLDRPALPGYNSDDVKSGAIDFKEHPVLTHPLEKNQNVTLSLPENISADTVTGEICKLIEKDSKTISVQGQQEEEYARKMFSYLHFILRLRLVEENVGGLGWLWERLAADSRVPDHTIWNHNAMTSAVGSSLNADANHTAALMVFSITPVQPFISASRKLRDHWTASVLLSYLAFEGIRWVMEHYGPDHVLYPSLIEQPFVENWLADSCGMKDLLSSLKNNTICFEKDSRIASFPNKFVFLLPADAVETAYTEMCNHIKGQWNVCTENVRDYILSKTECENTSVIENLFRRQCEQYWQFSYGAVNLLHLSHADDIAELFPKRIFEELVKTAQKFSSAFPNSNPVLYAPTHSAAQSMLAAGKNKPLHVRPPENGQKCTICGEREVLHDDPDAAKGAAGEYKKNVNKFWNAVRSGKGMESVFKEGETLCSLCTVKRLLPQSAKKLPDTITVKKAFSDSSFPSTTEMAASKFISALKTANITVPQNLIDILHECDEADEEYKEMRNLLKTARKNGIEYSEHDRYYALLVMDGDKMGDLVNGMNHDARWADIVHPVLSKKLSALDPRQWEELIDKRRLLSPAFHATVSEALGLFAYYSVAPIIKKYKGRLIYAGGDDICAVLPLQHAFAAADEIRIAYNAPFVQYQQDAAPRIITNDTVLTPQQRCGIHLGNAQGVSISAGITIAHHKAPLKGIIKYTHSLLSESAKNKCGRNAFALSLYKRSGGEPRIFAAQWNSPNPFVPGSSIVQSFASVVNTFAVSSDISSSLVYRLVNLKDAIYPLWAKDREKIQYQLIRQLFEYEYAHSLPKIMKNTEEKKRINRETAGHLAGLCLCGKADTFDSAFVPNVPVIARFLGMAQKNKGGEV